MTDEQINQTIAMALGWSNLPTDPSSMVQFTARNPEGKWDMVPNYCTDLNAIHEAELATFKTGFAWGEYFAHLAIVCDLGNDPITATARQRSEAFLRTIGKWEESES